MKILVPRKFTDKKPEAKGEYLTNVYGLQELYFDGKQFMDYPANEGGTCIVSEMTEGFVWYEEVEQDKILVDFGNYLFSTLGNRNINEVTHADLENFKHLNDVEVGHSES